MTEPDSTTFKCFLGSLPIWPYALLLYLSYSNITFVLRLHYTVDFMLIPTVLLLYCDNGPAEDVTESIRSETAD